MKKLLLSILVLTFFSWTHAQPVLNSSEMLPFGSVMQFKSIQDLAVIDTTIKGANAVWDFSTLSSASSTPSVVITIVNPASTPYGNNFPGSNYAYQETPTAYRYFNLSSTKMERLGSWYGSLKTYSDPQVEYVFPLQLGVSNKDTWANDQSSFGGTYDMYCIGYGTLTLPDATYFDALMVRVDVDETIYSFPVYFWYSSDNGAILLQYIRGDDFLISESGIYLSALSDVTGVKENEFSYDLRYNNPVENKLNLTFKSKKSERLEYSISNSLGEVAYSGNYFVNSQNWEGLELDLSTLTQGIYYLAIKSESSTQMIRLVKN